VIFQLIKIDIIDISHFHFLLMMRYSWILAQHARILAVGGTGQFRARQPAPSITTGNGQQAWCTWAPSGRAAA
jgi:succinate dehydrogenase/fumarate reductase flavoprotein subunit